MLAPSTDKPARGGEAKINPRITMESDSSRAARRFEGHDVRDRGLVEGTESNREQKEADLRVAPTLSDSSRRQRKIVPQEQTAIINNNQRSDGIRFHRYTTVRPSSVIYHDRPHLIRHDYHYDYAYRDYNGRICHRLVWPTYRYLAYYSHGPWFTFRYVYPYYHRKYLFISLGGYWPIGYSYLRYYWYGCHPYHWYGYYPIAREVEGDTYNYYTYNYYNNDDAAVCEPGQVADSGIFEDLARQAVEPDQPTLADVYFEEAVKAFETGEYQTAIVKFTKAMELAPEDVILPFAYSQALLANEQYSEAAEILRAALAKVSPEKEGVFYPRGLYANEDALLEQIEHLAEKAELYSFDADLQLLLGYQLLGIGEIDQAVKPLTYASKDLVNADAAAVLLELLEKIKTSDNKDQETDSGRTPIKSKAIIEGHSTTLKKTMFLASLCALVTSAGIGKYIRA